MISYWTFKLSFLNRPSNFLFYYNSKRIRFLISAKFSYVIAFLSDLSYSTVINPSAKNSKLDYLKPPFVFNKWFIIDLKKII